MVHVTIPAEQRLRLSGIPWEGYVAVTEALGARPIRVTYDRGEMEIMSPSNRHENRKRILGRLLETLTEELEIDIASGGSTTYRRKALARGLEPDESYWIAHERIVRGRQDIDLEKDPPPDLVLEIEISRSALDRMSIYAALRVPEVWRWDGETLTVNLLSTRGTYRQSDRSKAFPFLPLAEFARFLEPTKLSETQLLRSFRAWVRNQKKQNWKSGR
jgi:Uma2 family endonuclease